MGRTRKAFVFKNEFHKYHHYSRVNLKKKSTYSRVYTVTKKILKNTVISFLTFSTGFHSLLFICFVLFFSWQFPLKPALFTTLCDLSFFPNFNTCLSISGYTHRFFWRWWVPLNNGVIFIDHLVKVTLPSTKGFVL